MDYCKIHGYHEGYKICPLCQPSKENNPKERVFTLREAIEIFNDGGMVYYHPVTGAPNSKYKSTIEYFKDKFGITITGGENKF